MDRARQKLILLVLAVVLFAGGTVVLFFLGRIPFPARLVMALADYAAAAALLLHRRQHYSE